MIARGIPKGTLRKAPVNPERVREVLRLREEGWTYAAIGLQLGMTDSNVYFLIKRWAEWGLK